MKKCLIMFMLLMVVVLIPSCSKGVTTSEFPISKEVVESVVQGKDLKWEIVNEQYQEFQSSFVMKEVGGEPGRTDIGVTVLFDSIGNEDEKYLSVQMMYPNDYSVEQIQNEQVNNFPLLFDIASRIYGINDSSKKIYNEFVNYMDKDVDYENKGVQWEKEVNGTHVLIRISSLTKGIMHRKCAILIMSNASYEKYMNSIVSDEDVN